LIQREILFNTFQYIPPPDLKPVWVSGRKEGPVRVLQNLYPQNQVKLIPLMKECKMAEDYARKIT